MCGFLLKTYKKICANDRRLWTNCRNHNTDESRWERKREWEGPWRERKEGNWRERYSDYDLHMVLSARWMITNCPQLWSDCHHPPLPPSSLSSLEIPSVGPPVASWEALIKIPARAFIELCNSLKDYSWKLLSVFRICLGFIEWLHLVNRNRLH